MKWLACLLIFSASAWASSQDPHFNSIASINARTVEKGKFNFTKAPLNNLNASFLVSSLNFAPLSRLEIGTAPLFYAIRQHKYNFVLKYNFIRSEVVDWSLTYGENVFRGKIDENGYYEKLNIKSTALQLALNIHSPYTPWAMGFSLTNACGYLDSKNKQLKTASSKCTGETGIDLQRAIADNKWITVGYGRLRDVGFSPYEPLVTGLGGAYSMFRPKTFFSRPSLGYYQNFNGNGFLLLSTTFYEE